MLQLVHRGRHRLIDLGFYPEGDFVDGAYGQVMHEGNFTGPRLAECRTQDRAKLIATLEQWMAKVSRGEM